MKTKTLLFFALLAALPLLSACAGSENKSAQPPASATETAAPRNSTQAPQYRKISAAEAKRLLDGNKDAVLLDVRIPAEYGEKHIKGALLIPNETIGTIPPAQLPNKDALILIYCRSGNRSRQAAQKLIGMGYANVYDFGGINDWPYGIVSEK